MPISEKKRKRHSRYMRKYREKNREKINKYQKEYNKKWHKTLNGVFKRIFENQKRKEREKGIKYKVDYSFQELKDWCLKNEKFIQLYNKWRNSECKLNLRPVLDRINPMKGYDFKNLQVLTYKENNEKGYRERVPRNKKSVIQILKNGKRIKYNSITEASKSIGRSKTNICQALKGKIKTCKNSKWIYI